MKVFAGGIVGRYFEPDHVNSVLRLLRQPQIARYSPRFNDALLCRARSRNATEFLLDTDADVYLSIDSDIVFDAEDAIAICEATIDHDIVGGQYVTRTRGKYCFPTTLVEDDLTVTYADDHTLVPAKYVSGGFVAVHRRVFERLVDQGAPLLHEKDKNMRFYPFYQPFVVPGDGEQVYLSEDWALCERARNAGFGVWLDPAVRLLHLGQHPFRLEDMLVGQPPVQALTFTRRAGGRYDIDAYATSVWEGGET